MSERKKKKRCDDDDGISSSSKGYVYGDDCDVCGGGDSYEENLIVICEGCDVAVHQHCYGHPLTNGIPDGDWLCERCESKCKEEKCVCCPVRRGAMKRTIDFRWIHVSCAMYVPEAFCHAEGLDAINYFHIPKSRFELACSYCNFSKEGACVKCAYKGCKTSFHISCGMRQKVPILCEMKHIGKGKPDLVLTYCSEHAPIASKMGKKVRYQVA